MGYAESALLHGAQVKLNSQVTDATLNENSKIWNLTVQKTDRLTSIGRSEKNQILSKAPVIGVKVNQENENFQANFVINCSGLYGDETEHLHSNAITNNENGKKEFTITPRKGQFLVLELKNPNFEIPDSIIEPVSTQFTKGIIVWKSLYGNIIIGPTATNQNSKVDRSTDQETIEKLKNVG